MVTAEKYSTQFLHFAICTADIGQSTRFYCEALDFQEADSFVVEGKEIADAAGLSGDVKVQATFVRSSVVSIELVQFIEPGYVGDRQSAPANRIGLSHLCFSVADIERTAEHIVALGGTVFSNSRREWTSADGSISKLLVCSDPNGVRFELTSAAVQ